MIPDTDLDGSSAHGLGERSLSSKNKKPRKDWAKRKSKKVNKGAGVDSGRVNGPER